MNKDRIMSLLMLTTGAAVAAFALEEFLVPNHIFDGGVTGTGMILVHFVPLNLGILIILLNIPFLLYASKQIGRVFLLKAAYAMAMFSFMLAVFRDMQNATEDLLLATAFGGVFLGVGVGMVLRGGGCLDGTEIVGIIISRKTSMSVGKTVLLINIMIYTIAGIEFGLDRGMYSLLTYFITSKVIDLVETGFDEAKAVMIITGNGRKLADQIYQRLGRTVTFLQGEGLVSGNQKSVLYCVVTRAEIYELKKIIHNAGDSSFTTISDVSEIVGEHIKSRM